jgi:predicted amidohydrolase YtcJ
LSKDMLTVPDDAIPATQMDYTIVGGKIVFQR